MKNEVQIDEVPLQELMLEHCLKIAALIFYRSCSSFAFLLKKGRCRAGTRHVTAKHSN